MSTSPEVATASKQSAAPVQPLFGDCWSCRILSGGGLLFSGLYVYMAARKVMRRGAPTTIGTVAQIVFAASLASWGVVLIVDPVGRQKKM